MLADIPRLVTAYYTEKPDPGEPAAARQLRHFRPSRLLAQRLVQRSAHPGHHPGHLPTTARKTASTGPLFLAKDTHALSEPAFATALEVLAANGVEV